MIVPTRETTVRSHQRRKPRQRDITKVRQYKRLERAASWSNQHQVFFDELSQKKLTSYLESEQLRPPKQELDLREAPCGTTECLRANSQYCSCCNEFTNKAQDSCFYIDHDDPNAELIVEKEREEGLFNAV